MAACLLALAGCIVPAQYITAVDADVRDGRLVLALNVRGLGEREYVLAVYESARGDTRQWTLRGTYSGRSRGIAVRDGVLWVVFQDGSARTYPLREGAPARTAPSFAEASDGGPRSLGEGAAGPPDTDPRRVRGEIAKFPFDWKPLALCGDGEGGLWAVGIKDARIAAARLLGRPQAAWRHSFPAGPIVKELERKRAGPGPRVRRRGSRTGSAGRGTGPPDVRVRACVSDGLYVFWSVALPGADAAERIGAAYLGARPPGASPRAAGGTGRAAEWTELPALVFAHDDFCAAPTLEGAPGVVFCRPASRRQEGGDEGPLRAELDRSRGRWGPPEALAGASGRFLFGYMPRASWVRWEGSELLLRTNTQRVEILRRRDGRWEVLRPASSLALNLPEIWVAVFGGGGLVLALVGGSVLAVRMARLGRPGLRRAEAASATQAGRAGGISSRRRGPTELAEVHSGHGASAAAAPGNGEAPASDARLAPIAHRAIAALLDVIIIDSAATWLVGLPRTLANPLIPDSRSLVALGLALAMLAAYGAVLEAAFGATVGKLAVGLRVESAGGGRPSLGQVLLRNLLRPVDLLPPYLAAIGLSAMTLTRGRRRLGDLAAGTVVVKVAPEAGGGEKVRHI